MIYGWMFSLILTQALYTSKLYLTKGDIMEFAIAKVSTKGQIVIPTSLRKNIMAGDEFLIVKDEDRIVMKNVKSLAADIKDDMLFAQKVDIAWTEYDKGKFVKKSKEDFLKVLRSC